MHLKFLPGEKEMEPNTPLWRYMDAGKFMLLLLKRKAFIPKLSTLRKDRDPKETFVTSYSLDHLAQLLFSSSDGEAARAWLAERVERRFWKPSEAESARKWEQPFWRDPAGAFERNSILFDEWLDQLSARRAVWCWASPRDPETSESPESLAMWNMYAPKGVAIKTTLDNIEKVFDASPDLKNQEWKPIRVTYHRQGYRTQRLLDDLIEKERLKQPFRPYAFKSLGYEFEHEIRIVVRVNGETNLPGIAVEVNPQILLKGGEVVVSPYVTEPEADDFVQAVKHLLKDDPNIVVRHSSERQQMPQELASLVGNFMAAGPNGRAAPFAREENLPTLLSEL